MKKFKTKKSKSTTAATSESIVVSDGFKKQSLFARLNKRQRSIVLLLIVAVVGASVGAIWYAQTHKETVTKAPLSADIDTDYETANKSDLPVLLEHDYGFTPEQLQSADFSKELKSFEMAHNVGLAMYRLGKLDRAVAAYKVIDQKYAKDATYLFYKEFCGLAYRAGDTTLSDTMCDKSVALINSTVTDETEKKDLTSSIERGRAALRKTEGN